MSRPTIAVGLPAAERGPVLEALGEAGFGTVSLESASDLAAVIEAELPIGLAVLDAGDDRLSFLETGAHERLRLDGIPLLIITDDAHLDSLAASGDLAPEDEVILRPLDAEGLRWRAEAILIRAQTVAGHAEGAVVTRGPIEADWASRTPIIAIFNPKGGVGKTTLATNLSASLVAMGRRVLLVDADTVTGHVPTSLGMEGVVTVVDAWRDELEGGPVQTFDEIAGLHSSGLRVLSLASSPIHTDILEPQRVAAAVTVARRHVDFVVVDLHPSYSPLNRALFDRADRILVPVTPDLPAIRAVAQLRDVADELGMRDRLRLIVNRANSGVAVADVEKAIGIPVYSQIRSDGLLLVKAANEGRTVVEMAPREKITQDFNVLARRILGLPDPEPVKAQLRLFGRTVTARA